MNAAGAPPEPCRGPSEGSGIVPDEVTFESGSHRLKGYLYVPAGPGPFACVVNNHGSQLRPGTWDVARPQTAALFLSWGYAFFYPHRAGYGNSPGEPLAKAISAPLGTADYDDQIVRRLNQECSDVGAAVAYLRGHSAIDGDRIALGGSSRGGIVSLLATADDKRIAGCINFCGGARQWADHPKLRAKMLAAGDRLAVPIFLAQAQNDYNLAAPMELAARLETAGKPHECRIYPPWGFTREEGHLFELHGALVWGPDVKAFLQRCLTGDTRTQPLGR